MGHCMSPCLGDLDPNAYRRRLDEALALFEGPEEASGLLLGHIEARMREAAGERRFERAEVLRRRLERLADLLSRMSGVLRATHACSRLVLARHPSKRRFDAFWIVGGRVRDWGPLPEVRGADGAHRGRAGGAAAPAVGRGAGRRGRRGEDRQLLAGGQRGARAASSIRAPGLAALSELVAAA